MYLSVCELEQLQRDKSVQPSTLCVSVCVRVYTGWPTHQERDIFAACLECVGRIQRERESCCFANIDLILFTVIVYKMEKGSAASI